MASSVGKSQLQQRGRRRSSRQEEIARGNTYLGQTVYVRFGGEEDTLSKWFKGIIERRVHSGKDDVSKYDVYYEADNDRYVQSFDEETMESTFWRKGNVRYIFRWSPPSGFRDTKKNQKTVSTTKDSYLRKKVFVSFPGENGICRWYKGTVKRLLPERGRDGKRRYVVKYEDQESYIQSFDEEAMKSVFPRNGNVRYTFSWVAPKKTGHTKKKIDLPPGFRIKKMSRGKGGGKKGFHKLIIGPNGEKYRSVREVLRNFDLKGNVRASGNRDGTANEKTPSGRGNIGAKRRLGVSSRSIDHKSREKKSKRKKPTKRKKTTVSRKKKKADSNSAGQSSSNRSSPLSEHSNDIDVQECQSQVPFPVPMGARVEAFFDDENKWEPGTIVHSRVINSRSKESIVEIMFDFGACEIDVEVSRKTVPAKLRYRGIVASVADTRVYKLGAMKARQECDIVGWDHRKGSLGNTDSCVDIAAGCEKLNSPDGEPTFVRIPLLGSSTVPLQGSSAAKGRVGNSDTRVEAFSMPPTFTYVREPVVRLGMSVDAVMCADNILSGRNVTSTQTSLVAYGGGKGVRKRRCDCRECMYCLEYDGKSVVSSTDTDDAVCDHIRARDGGSSKQDSGATTTATIASTKKMGCSKCRWRPNGCGRCKKSKFKPGPIEWQRRLLMISGKASDYEVLKQMWNLDTNIGGIRARVAISKDTKICKALRDAGQRAGHGLVAAEPIGENVPVLEYVGELLTHKQARARELHYAAETSKFRNSSREGSPNAIESGCCYQLDVGRYVIDATVFGNASRFINHSCEPNCVARRLQRTGQSYSTTAAIPRVMIYTLRPIAEGEELTWSYNGLGVKGPNNGTRKGSIASCASVVLSERKCLCGSEKCVGRL
eukprot:g913.t1